jgi:hypothetical protein
VANCLIKDLEYRTKLA